MAGSRAPPQRLARCLPVRPAGTAVAVGRRDSATECQTRVCRARALPTRAPARPARLSLLTLSRPSESEADDLNSTRGSRGCGVQLSTSDERQHRGPGGPFCPNLSQFRRLCARRSTCALGFLPRGSAGAPARRLRMLAACRGACAARGRACAVRSRKGYARAVLGLWGCMHTDILAWEIPRFRV